MLLTVSALQIKAQDSYIKDRWTVKLGYQTYLPNKDFSPITYRVNEFAVSGNYGVLNYLECGVSVFASKKSVLLSGFSLSYVANVNFHILPFFVDEETFKLDAYLSSNIGGESQIASNSVFSSNYLIYNFGLGAAYYPLKHFGIYSEFAYGKCDFRGDSYKFKIGLVYKFKK